MLQYWFQYWSMWLHAMQQDVIAAASDKQWMAKRKLLHSRVASTRTTMDSRMCIAAVWEAMRTQQVPKPRNFDNWSTV